MYKLREAALISTVVLYVYHVNIYLVIYGGAYSTCGVRCTWELVPGIFGKKRQEKDTSMLSIDPADHQQIDRSDSFRASDSVYYREERGYLIQDITIRLDHRYH